MNSRGIIFSLFATSASETLPTVQRYGFADLRTIVGITAVLPLSASSTAALPIAYACSTSTFDATWRAARHVASKVDVAQAYACGKAAVELALKGHNAVMPTIVRTSDKPYRWKVGSVSLADVANKEKMMPRNFISPDGFAITAACRKYLAPLIAGEDYPPYKNGLPSYVSLRNQRVTRRLKTEFVLK